MFAQLEIELKAKAAKAPEAPEAGQRKKMEDQVGVARMQFVVCGGNLHEKRKPKKGREEEKKEERRA